MRSPAHHRNVSKTQPLCLEWSIADLDSLHAASSWLAAGLQVYNRNLSWVFWWRRPETWSKSILFVLLLAWASCGRAHSRPLFPESLLISSLPPPYRICWARHTFSANCLALLQAILLSGHGCFFCCRCCDTEFPSFKSVWAGRVPLFPQRLVSKGEKTCWYLPNTGFR